MYNHYNYKARVAPHDYLNGPVRVYTSEEIAEWESDIDPVLLRKVMEAQSMGEDEVKFLDTLSLVQAEDTYSEILEGVVGDAPHE